MGAEATDMRGIEKHIITIAVSVITALLVWVGYSTQQTAVGVAELRVEVRAISAFQMEINDRVHRLEDEH